MSYRVYISNKMGFLYYTEMEYINNKPQHITYILMLPASVERHNNDNKHGHIRKKFFSIF